MPSSNNGDITLSVGLDTSNAERTAQDLEEEVKKIFSTQTTDDSKFTALNAALKQNVLEAQKLQAQLDSLRDVEVPTEEYKEIEAFIQKDEDSLNKLIEKMRVFKELGGDVSSDAFTKMRMQAEELRDSIDYSKGDLQDLVDTGKAFTLGKDSEEYKRIERELDKVNDKTKVNLVKHQQINNELKKSPENVKKTHKELRKMPNVLDKIKSGTQNIFKSFLKWGLGISSVMALIRKLRSAVSEGFQNLFQDMPNSGLTKQVNELKNSVIQLKNALAASLAPILQTIIPYLQQFINWLIKGISTVGQFFAALTGKKTVLKATKIQDGYHQSLDKTAKSTDKTKKATDKAAKSQEKFNKQLGSFDELNNITTNDNDDMADSFDDLADAAEAAGEIAPAVMSGFEEVPIDSAIAEWAEKIKKMLKEAWATGDFSKVGAFLGEQLKQALDAIPWDRIQDLGIKLGKSVATLINGFVEVEGLGESIGNTVAQFCNTLVYTIESFLDNLHAISLGDFFGNIVQSFFDNTDWTAIGHTISLFISKTIELLVGFIETFDFGSIVDALIAMFEGLDWARLTADVGLLFFGIIKGAIQLLLGLLGGIWHLLADVFRELGWDCVAGLFDGIAEKIKEGRQKVQEFFQKIVDAVKETLGIHSPSTVFADMGKNIVLGLLEGLKEKIPNFKESIRNMFESAKQIVSNALATIGNWVSNKAQSWANKINEIKARWNSLGGGSSYVQTYHSPTRTSLTQAPVHHLAQGAVIPPNKEFMAVLGDQKSGTNIETPLSTMVEAFNQASGGASAEELSLMREQNELLRGILERCGITDNQIFKSVQRSAVDYRKQNGKPAFGY